LTLGSVTSLFRYPVKSMAGEPLGKINIGPKGVPGDRAWAVRDEERGGIRGAKRFATLMACAARYQEEPAETGSSPAEIVLPSGQKLMTTDDGAAAALSDTLGSPVTLWPLLPADALDHYKRGAGLSDDLETELRRVFARTPDEPLPDLSVFPPELIEYESPPGTYFDALPLLLATQQSLDTLSAAAPKSRFDVRRFRPNIFLDAAGDAKFPEQDWVGKRARLGSAELKIELGCPRCVMTTHPFDDLPKDPTIMRTFVKEAGGDLGVYASVMKPGTVSVGDRIEILD